MSEEALKTKAERESIRKRVREQTLGYIIGAFGLVAGLSWNDAVKALIEYLYPATQTGSVAAKFVYAVIITLAVVLITTYLTRLMQRNEEKK